MSPDTALAGSLTAVPPRARPAAAAWLARRGLWVHLDIIDESYADGRGVTLTEASVLAADGRVDAHLMVADPLRTARSLPSGLDRLTVQVEDLDGLSPRRTCESLRELTGVAELWLALRPQTALGRLEPYLPHADGVLQLLVQPAATGTVADPAVLDRIGTITDSRPAGVDGGVTGPVAARARASGASFIVSGRALLGDGTGLDDRLEAFLRDAGRELAPAAPSDQLEGQP